MANSTTKKWQRICPGLYVDPTQKWVISREGRGWYSVRELTGWGLTLNNKKFPDYGDIWHGDYWSLADAKTAVMEMAGQQNG